MRLASFAALLGAVVLAGCGGGDAAPDAGRPATAAAASEPAKTIRIEDFLFVPSPATIKAGETISVVNADAAPHTLTDQPQEGTARFDTGILRGRRTGSFAAPDPGTYAIFCELHPFMKGELEVVG